MGSGKDNPIPLMVLPYAGYPIWLTVGWYPRIPQPLLGLDGVPPSGLDGDTPVKTGWGYLPLGLDGVPPCQE